MAEFDNKAFTERIATLYPENLRRALPTAKFRFGEHEELTDLIAAGAWRIERDFGPWVVQDPFDGYLRPDGTVREDLLAPAYADALSAPVIRAAKSAVESEEAAQLWILHRIVRHESWDGGAQVDFVGMLGQTFWDKGSLQQVFRVRTEWAVGLAPAT